jgi:hypothetical protein
VPGVHDVATAAQDRSADLFETFRPEQLMLLLLGISSRASTS